MVTIGLRVGGQLSTPEVERQGSGLKWEINRSWGERETK